MVEITVEASAVAVQTMKAALLDSGVEEERIALVDTLDKAYVASKLTEIWNNQYQSYMEARSLREEDKWAYYEMMGITGLREQGILSEARKELRRAWKIAFRKAPDNANAGSGDQESEHARGAPRTDDQRAE